MPKIFKNLKLLTILPAIAALLTVASASAWGPERDIYTNEKPADYAVFNSIVNNAAVGDERDFVRVGEAGSDAPYTNEIEVVPGKEYEVYIYYHNDAASSTNATGYGIATQTRIAASYPTTIAKNSTGTLNSVLTWNYVDTNDQTHDGKIWDEAYLKAGNEDVVLKFKTGSAIIHNGGAANGSTLSPDYLFSERGTLIGYNELKGVMPGCAEFSGYITYTLIAEKTSATLNKQVSYDGENWADTITVEPGQYVTYKVSFENTGNTTLQNVIFKDTHDDKLSLKFGSTTIYNFANMNGLQLDDILDISGYGVDKVVPGELVQIIYQSQVAEDAERCSVLKNTMTVSYNLDQEMSDSTTVQVGGDNCESVPDEPTPTPDDPGTPSELPNTGPAEIAMAAVIVLGIMGGGIYLWRTRYVVKTVEKRVSGSENRVDEKNAEKTEVEKSSENRVDDSEKHDNN